MANNLFNNNASALLAASISDSDLVVQVDAGFGVNFPSPSGGQFFYLTLEDTSGNIEVVQVTSRTVDLLTVVRAQDNTIAQSFTLLITRCELRVVAVSLEGLAQRDGAVFTGDLDMNQNSVIDAYISGVATRMTAGQIAGVPLRDVIDNTSNEIAVPVGTRATAGGIPLVVNTDDLEAQLTDTGVIAFAPATGIEFGEDVGGYLRLFGPVAGDYLELLHDGTGFAFDFNNVDIVAITGASASYDFDNLVNISAGGITISAGDLTMTNQLLIGPKLIDFSIIEQVVTGIATTDIDYELGSYVTLNLTADITTFSVSNPPTGAKMGTMRIKIVQDTTPRTITWPASVRWPQGGTAPTLSTGSGAIDFVDLWTDSGGTVWFGVFNSDWS